MSEQKDLGALLPPDGEQRPGGQAEVVAGERGRSARKTPMFQAMHAARYQRQSIINKIRDLRKREVICYVGGTASEIGRRDVIFLTDLLHNVSRGSSVDLLLHTPGGDMDAAEKLSLMVREVVGTGELTVVLPDYAKSSGTLIALGADRLMMSDTSELGPIDPQIMVDQGDGKRMQVSLISYLNAYESYAKLLRDDPSDVVARLMLDKFDPTKLHQLQMAKDRVLKIAEKQLVQGMFRTPPLGNFTGIPKELINVDKYASHGQMIGFRECKGLGLRVDYRAPGDEEWDLFWQLYCFQRLEISDNPKKILFESSYACLASE